MYVSNSTSKDKLKYLSCASRRLFAKRIYEASLSALYTISSRKSCDSEALPMLTVRVFFSMLPLQSYMALIFLYLPFEVQSISIGRLDICLYKKQSTGPYNFHAILRTASLLEEDHVVERAHSCLYVHTYKYCTSFHS